MIEGRATHPQISIRYGELKADVDAGIAQLIIEVWHAGIMTTMSCQDVPPMTPVLLESGAPGGIRTADPQIRSQWRYDD
jgi:hypothetical protein